MSISLRFVGVDDLLRKLKLLRAMPSKSARDRAVLKGAWLIADEAKRLVPVKSGNLRDSITVSNSDRGGAAVGLKSNGVLASIGPSQRDGWYGHMVEFGTVEMPARPFMRPAFDAKHKEAEREIANALKVEIRRAVEG